VITLEWDNCAEDGALTLHELQASDRRVLGADVALRAPTGDGPFVLRRIAGGNSRLASRFLDRRVLLLGDAAHVHSAIGGAALNPSPCATS
jgi:2-polyprenyl-6-methoxyphenol hydroxylase-like FAD-dependent oxidoreductase